MRPHRLSLLAGLALGTVALRADGQAPLDRDARWRADLRFLASELPARHKNAFAYLDRETFARAVAELDTAIPGLSDNQVQLRLARIVGLVRDGHTAIATPLYLQRLPIVVLWAAQGAFIVNASDDYASAIGARITRINDAPIAAVADTLRQYMSIENDQAFRNAVGGLVTRAGVLSDVGLGGDGQTALLELEHDGRRDTVRVSSVPARDWTAPQRVEPPLYRREPTARYWWTAIDGGRAIFIKYNRCEDDKAFRAMTDSIAHAIDANGPRRVIVDLRDNPGGNSAVIQPLVDAIRARAAINRRDVLYAIIGRGTFSSGLMAGVEFRQATNATLVGEPTGEHPNHYGEVRSFDLPNSRLRVSYSTTFHRIVDGDPDALHPDVEIPVGAADYIAGRDPVVEWILGRRP